jgi:hypothetical protein
MKQKKKTKTKPSGPATRHSVFVSGHETVFASGRGWVGNSEERRYKKPETPVPWLGEETAIITDGKDEMKMDKKGRKRK